MFGWNVPENVSDWILSAGVLAGTLIAVGLTRAALRALYKHRGLGFVRELAPSLANLVYIIGARAFLEVAPIEGKLDVWLEHAVYVLTVIIILGLIRQAAMMGMEWGTLRSNRSQTLHQGFIPLMKNVATLFVFFMGAIMILKHFNYDVMSLITALGVGSLAVGLAAKDTLSNMISGFTLIIDRNLKPGDRINLTGQIGDVEEIGLRSTRIKMGDGNTLIVPNADLVNNRILNLSIPSSDVSCSTVIRVPASVQFQKVKQICLSTIGEVEKAVQTRGKWVQLASLSEGVQRINVGFWVAHMDHQGEAISDFNERLVAKLSAQGIPLAAPTPALSS